jgi:hypothetical protein
MYVPTSLAETRTKAYGRKEKAQNWVDSSICRGYIEGIEPLTEDRPMPKFISIQDGAYLLNLAHIVSIEVNEDSLEVTCNDGNGAYTVDNSDEMAKLLALIEVA